MTSTNQPQVRTNGADTAIYLSSTTEYAAEVLHGMLRDNVIVRLWDTPDRSTAASLTPAEARVLAEALVRAANAADPVAITVPAVPRTVDCVDCGQPIGDRLPVVDGDGSNVRHAECDDKRAQDVEDIMDLLGVSPAVTEAEMQVTVAKAVEKFLAMANAHPDTPTHLGYHFTAEQSGRNYRIVVDMGGQKSVHAFIDRTTGDVYKPEGWKRAAKGVRYNIVTEYDLVAERFGWAGGYLYNEVAGKR